MVLEALLLICSIPQMDDAAKLVSDSPAVVSDTKTTDSTASASLPSMPTPKANAEAIQPATPGQPFQPVKPAFTRPRETPRQRIAWYALTMAGSSGAAFDAWSTRRAISGGFGQESNPFLKPFAHSNALYAATQVSPAFMDFIGKRMMTSRHEWMRKMWWVPQTAGTSMSLYAGVHNTRLVP